MKIIPAKTPGVVKSLFPNFVWSINTSEKTIYLTFDDGPTPAITDWVLTTLKAFNAKATFFCIGNNIEKHPDIFQRIFSQGHTIGNHTQNHLKGWKHSTKKYINDIEKTEVLIRKYSKENKQKPNTKTLFRPPYGKLKLKQAKALQKLNYCIVLWDVLSFDWDSSVSEEKCLSNVKTNAKEGSIIVFHDSVKGFKNLKYTLPKTLKYFSEKGYAFKAL